MERSGVERTALLRADVCETPFATTDATVFGFVTTFLLVAVCDVVVGVA